MADYRRLAELKQALALADLAFCKAFAEDHPEGTPVMWTRGGNLHQGFVSRRPFTWAGSRDVLVTNSRTGKTYRVSHADILEAAQIAALSTDGDR